MKNVKKTKTINRFSAVTTSFRAEFTRRNYPQPRVNLKLSTILSNDSATDGAKWLESLLEIWHQGAMVFDSSGSVVQTTEFTSKMVEKYFPNAELDKDGLPVEVSNWMKLYQFEEKGALSRTRPLCTLHAAQPARNLE